MPRIAPLHPRESPGAQVSYLHSNLSPEMEWAIQACLQCKDVLEDTLLYCLQEGGKHSAVALITLMLDCAEICQITVNFIRRNSALQGAVSLVCEQVANRCAEACAIFTDDERLRQCAQACRTCAEACRNVVSTVPLMPM